MPSCIEVGPTGSLNLVTPYPTDLSVCDFILYASGESSLDPVAFAEFASYSLVTVLSVYLTAWSCSVVIRQIKGN